MQLSGIGREFPALTGRSGTQRAHYPPRDCPHRAEDGPVSWPGDFDLQRIRNTYTLDLPALNSIAQRSEVTTIDDRQDGRYGPADP
jgi:hypothetical protein